jgi:hypothetical protein
LLKNNSNGWSIAIVDISENENKLVKCYYNVSEDNPKFMIFVPENRIILGEKKRKKFDIINFYIYFYFIFFKKDYDLK